MQAMLLFLEPVSAMTSDVPPAWAAYIAQLRAAGVMRGGEHLAPPATATTLRLAEGRRTVQDGPFLDSKEQLGGFILIEVPGMAEALEWAARCPAAAVGAVEVRPVLPPPPA